MNSKLPEVSDQDLHGRIDEFMSRFKFGTLLNRAGIRKIRGLSPLLVFRSIFDLAFAGRNIYTGIMQDAGASIGKDALYRFMATPRYNWRRLVALLAQMVIRGLIQPLTDASRGRGQA